MARGKGGNAYYDDDDYDDGYDDWDYDEYADEEVETPAAEVAMARHLLLCKFVVVVSCKRTWI